MGHEHHGECCSHKEEHNTNQQHEHMHEIATRLGNLCVLGACSHTEHNGVGLGFNQHLMQQFQNEAEQKNAVTSLKSKKKRKNYSLIN